MKINRIIFISIIAILVVLLAIFLISPTLRSFITGIPVHFSTLDQNSTRTDIVAIYGESIGTTPSGLELYTAEFLDVKGHISVTYIKNTDQVFIVQFAIRSSDYATIAEYEDAVQKTHQYFDLVLFRLPKETGALGGDSWSKDSARIAYTTFASNIYHDETGTYYTTEEQIEVFQFNTYTDEMAQDAEDILKDFEDLLK